MDIVGYHIPGLAAATAAFSAVYGAFAVFDKDQSDDNRKFVRDWLFGLKVDTASWNQFFEELFSRSFGSKHRSIKCVTRSFMLSASIIIGIFLLVIVRRIFVFGETDALSWRAFSGLGLILSVGCVADYFSLWKTRFLLTKFSSFRSGFAAVAVVIGDFVATFLILLLSWFIFSWFFGAALLFAGGEYNWQTFLSSALLWMHQLFSVFLQGPSFDIPLWPVFVAGFLTSAWLWIYLMVAYGMRGLGFLLRWLTPLSKITDLENHPVRTIGYVAAAVSAVVVGVISIL